MAKLQIKRVAFNMAHTYKKFNIVIKPIEFVFISCSITSLSNDSTYLEALATIPKNLTSGFTSGTKLTSALCNITNTSSIHFESVTSATLKI